MSRDKLDALLLPTATLRARVVARIARGNAMSHPWEMCCEDEIRECCIRQHAHGGCDPYANEYLRRTSDVKVCS